MMNSFPYIKTTQKALLLRKPVYGVGINDASYLVKPRIDGKMQCCPIYEVWKAMLMRCYSEAFQAKHPTYAGCTVVEGWHKFMAFRAWMTKQQWEGCHLDKDLMVSGNKVYGPETCLFVSPRVNLLMGDNASRRGDLPVGVRLHRGRYDARCTSRPEGRHIGRLDTPEEAHQAWRIEKKKVVRLVARQESSTKVRQALMRIAYRL